MKYNNIYLKKGKEESLRRYHPWVFSGAINHIDNGVKEGDIVRILTNSNEFIAIGHYQIGSIAVRVLSFEDIVIDENYWYSCIHSAYTMRLSTGIANQPQNDTFRLVHGEGDGLPGYGLPQLPGASCMVGALIFMI